MQTTTLSNQGNRIVFLDFIRVVACFLVVAVHASENFYNTIAEGNFFWLNAINSAMRACVQLFVMVSSYLLLPLKESPGTFYKRRFMRIIIPFAIWSVLYAVLPYLWGEFDGARVKAELTRLTYNFNYYAQHMWFIYMLIGVYAIMPIISPWLEKVSKRFEEGFLIAWLLTTLYHYVKLAVPEVLGECPWNEFTAFWYISGYIGYVVLAHYIRTHIDWSVKKSLAVGIPLYLAGYLMTYFVFKHFANTSENLAEIETGWRFCTINVALMTAGLFILMKKVRFRSQCAIRWLADLSKMSFGIFLMHMMLVRYVFKAIYPYIESVPLNIAVVSIVTFFLCYGLTKALSFLPKSKYIIG